MATYYVDNDVGPTGGSGTQQNPYGIETAIAGAQAGDVFYWRGGGEGDVSPGHTLDFNAGGTASAPVRWVGTDDDWVPIPAGAAPPTGVDGADGAYPIVTVSSAYQIFENVRMSNALQGRHGGVVGCRIAAARIMMRNCVALDCGTGFRAEGAATGVFLHCRANDVWTGFHVDGFCPIFQGCVVSDTESHAFRAGFGGSVLGCQVFNVGGSGVELYLDFATSVPLTVDHLSVYNCAEGVRINAHNGINANVFSVTNSIFDTGSGYAVNVTAPAGQLGTVLNNASRNCAGGQVPAGRTGLISEDWIALAVAPFVDGAGGDLSLVRGTPAIGAATDGGDLGAVQRRFVRLPYPLIGAA